MRKLLLAFLLLALPAQAAAVNPIFSRDTNSGVVSVWNGTSYVSVCTITGGVCSSGSAGSPATTTTPGTVYAGTAPSSRWLSAITSGTGALVFTQPGFADISGSLACAQRPALTGDVTSPAGSCATTAVSLNGTAFTSAATTPLGSSGSTIPLYSTVAANFLSQTNAASTYLTQSNAATTYLSQTNAASTYLSQSSAAATYAPIAYAVSRSSVRQTVQGGPASAGAPTFLNASSASLVPTFQNISTGVNAFTVSAAQGSNSTGQLDYVTQLTSNPTGPTCPASGTDYIYENAQTGALSCNALQPIYQYGGTISTTNGQFTFDYQVMIGYLGNGTSAVATPLVALGECTASASALSGCIAYAYNGYYDSGFTATLPAAGTLISYNHNLGVAAATPLLLALCTTAASGYSVGDIFVPYTSPGTGLDSPFSSWVTRNTGGFTTGNNASFRAVIKNTGLDSTLTSSSFSYKMIFRRGWGGA